MSPLYDWIDYLPRWQAARVAAERRLGSVPRSSSGLPSNNKHVVQALMSTFAAMADLRGER